MISTYAPPNENDTSKYVDRVAKYCYMRPDEGIRTDLDLHDMLVAMYMIESGVPEREVPDETIWNVIGWLSPELERLGLRFTRFLKTKDELKKRL